MSDRLNAIIDHLNGLNALELAQLSKMLQEMWGVSAAAPVAMAMPGAGAAAAPVEAPKVEEQTEFDVVLKEIGAQKLQVIKVVRELTGLGLKEAKDAVESAPNKIKEKVSKEEAEAAKAKLVEVGAVIEIK